MDHHPLRRVEDEGIGELDSVQEIAQFRTEQSGSGVRRVHVQPETLARA